MKLVNIFLILFLCSCAVGPEYKKPTIDNKIPENFKEDRIKWQTAKPNADIDRGQWWKIYNDPILDELEDKLNKNNQNIVVAEKNFNQALALIYKSRANYFPNISAAPALTRQREKTTDSHGKTVYKTVSSHSLGFTSSWELDLWNSTGYLVDYDLAGAEASKADLASIKLSEQSSLAQYYFEFRMVEKDQQLLNDIAEVNKKILEYTNNRHKAGIASKDDLLKAENNYQSAQVSAVNNEINLAQYQHAIAILIGELPSNFAIKSKFKIGNNKIIVPLMLPSQLLERRPDIAKAEKLVEQANAQIGTASTAFFPTLNLVASSTLDGANFGNLLSMPNLIWSLGPQMAIGIFDGNARVGQKKANVAAYESKVASYRQTVLNAFVEVEDQLAALNSLKKQLEIQEKAAKNAQERLKLVHNQYLSGMVDYAQFYTIQIEMLTANKSVADILGLQRVAEINLIKALGGGWQNNNIKEKK